MVQRIVIEGVEFQGHIGVSSEERGLPQLLGVDLELDYRDLIFNQAAQSDALSRAMDYSEIVTRVIQVGTDYKFHLLEALAERMSRTLFDEFPIDGIRLWIRKLTPPLKGVQGSVGLRLARTRADYVADPKPAPFLLDHWHKLPHGIVLDVAAGHGRNALYLATRGFAVEAVDRDQQTLEELANTARQRELKNLTVRTVDLEAHPDHPPDFSKEHYDVILVFFYLYRPIFPSLLQALKPGGVLMYETFLIDNHIRHQHPRRREFCLEHNELLQLVRGLRILSYEEGEHAGWHESDREFTARLLAQKEA